jgi:hypothetical protein
MDAAFYYTMTKRPKVEPIRNPTLFELGKLEHR